LAMRDVWEKSLRIRENYSSIASQSWVAILDIGGLRQLDKVAELFLMTAIGLIFNGKEDGIEGLARMAQDLASRD